MTDTTSAAPHLALHLSGAPPLRPDAPWLAPLAGYSDLPFRLLCREHGAAACCTEMVSAKGLLYHSPGTRDLLAATPEDAPLVLQLFGADADIMRTVMPGLMEQGFRWFDLNMGCSVPKVVKTGCGSAMSRDMDNALAVARAMVEVAGEGRVGFKMRLGWQTGEETWREMALRLQDAGAGWITLHPRFARQGFGGEARWSALRELAATLTIPVIASGDLFTAADAVRCVRETGVATVMFARGAMNNPAIFEEYRTLLAGGQPPPPDADRLKALIRRHLELALAHSGERTALLKMRTFVPRYVRHIPGVRALRNRLASCLDRDLLEELLETHLTPQAFAENGDGADPADATTTQPDGDVRP